MMINNYGCFHLSHVMRKHVYAMCEQQRHRSACTSTYLYFVIQKTLAGFCSGAGRFESYLVRNPEDKFSRDMAHFIPKS